MIHETICLISLDISNASSGHPTFGTLQGKGVQTSGIIGSTDLYISSLVVVVHESERIEQGAPTYLA